MPKLSDQQAQATDEAEGGYELLDPGVYLGSLNQVTEKAGDKGPYWEWEFLLEETDEGVALDNPSKVWENTSLSERALFRLKDMFAAFEVPTDTDTEDLLGTYVWVSVGQEPSIKDPSKLVNVFLGAQPIPDEAE